MKAVNDLHKNHTECSDTKNTHYESCRIIHS